MATLSKFLSILCLLVLASLINESTLLMVDAKDDCNQRLDATNESMLLMVDAKDDSNQRLDATKRALRCITNIGVCPDSCGDACCDQNCKRTFPSANAVGRCDLVYRIGLLCTCVVDCE